MRGPPAVVLVASVLLGGCELLFAPSGAPRDGAGSDAPLYDDAPRVDAPRADAFMPPDAGVDGSSVMDTDSDGVFDNADNCVFVMNADQRDHDADATGDACDPCPHLSGGLGNDTDNDGDGVGDGCDPRPTMPGDTPLAFHGFYESTEISGWASLPPTWNFDPGTGEVNVTKTAGGYLVSDVIGEDVFIMISARGIDEAAGAGVAHDLGVTITDAGGERHSCLAHHESGVPAQAVYRFDNGAFYTDFFGSWGGDLVGNGGATRTVVAFALQGNVARCTVWNDTGFPFGYVDATVSAHHGPIEINANEIDAAVDYLYVARYGP